LKTIHFLVHHRPGRSPGQRFRFEQYLPFLKEAGFDYRISNLLNTKQDHLFYSHGNYLKKAGLVMQSFLKRWKDVQKTKPGDIVFIYREAFMLGNTLFERKIHKKGIPIIFDFDDAIWLMEVSEGNKKVSFLKNPDKTKAIIRFSSLVITGNDYLRDYALQFNPNTIKIPTTIDTAYHKPMEKQAKNTVCIGWTGTESTVKHFETIIPILMKLKEKYKDRISFKLITNKPVSFPALGLTATIWNREEEIKQLNEIDIGIMPLPDDEWSRGKCGFKGLQYMAMEIPAVMSPVGVNREIITNGENGFLCADEQQWIDKLSALIDDPALRQQLGKEGRKTVKDKYSVQSQKDKYIKAFRSV
jgi:glycosyltransferase involved in cell wall biosynthesis